jgi:hypothetical protein|eukprot:evm.model.NODE_304_length_7458_cov_52.294716.3
MEETPEAIRSRAVLDLVHAFKVAQAGFVARKQRQATQASRWKNNTTKSGHQKNGKKKRAGGTYAWWCRSRRERLAQTV